MSHILRIVTLALFAFGAFLIHGLAQDHINPSLKSRAVPQNFELSRDPIDSLTGEHLDAGGQVPARTDNRFTPSYALMTNEVLWREVDRSSQFAFIALKTPTERRGFFKGQLLIRGEEVENIKRNLLASIPGLKAVRDGDPQFRLPRTPSGMVFPGFFASITKPQTVAALRARKEVDYIEPRYLAMVPQDSIACGFEPYSPATTSELLDGNLGGDIVPYSFRHMGITDAWNRFQYSGQGVRLALLDTGISSQQDQLQSQFSVGAPRPAVTHLDTTGTGPEDVCGHGTKVAGILAAPKDGRSIVGALWGATLTTVKVGGSPQHSIPDSGAYELCAGIAAAKAARAQIVVMSLGYPFYSPTIAECITDAFDSTSMIFVAAAGTQVSWVVFPASMDREVVAASAVRVSGPDSYRLFAVPFTVAYGPSVDFAAVTGDNRVPSPGRVGNATSEEIAAGGGTSAAAPHIAGVIGLAIQSLANTNPIPTREQIIARVRAASSVAQVRDANGQPLQPGNIGSGIPNAYLAAGGTTNFDLVGPAIVQVNQPFTYSGVSNGDSALDYTWTADNGARATTQTVTFTSSRTGKFGFSVTAVDPVDGKSFLAHKDVQVIDGPAPPPTVRELTSVDYVSAGASLLTGGRGDFIVNPGISMPSGCVVLARRGQTQCTDGGIVHDCSDSDAVAAANYTGYGFSVSAPAAAKPENLDTDIHVWYDGVHSITVRAHYLVSQPAGISCDVPGHTLASQMCSNDNQCASLSCNGSAAAPGTCAARKGLGGACSMNSNCNSGYCDAGNGTSHTGLCMPNNNGVTGDICSNDNQCQSLSCGGLKSNGSGGWIPGACSAAKKVGSSCAAHAECASGFCDSGVCAAKSSLGLGCSSNAQCTTGYCDAGNGTSHTGLCMPNGFGQNGDICSNDHQCGTLNCAGLVSDGHGGWTPGHCGSKKSLGSACSANSQCGSGYCDAGDGTSKTGLCMPNHDGQNGDICSNDNQCISQSCGGLTQSGGSWIPGKCSSARALGVGCSAHNQCASGYCDAGNGTSRTNLCMPNGNGRTADICSHNNQCASRNCNGLHANGNQWVPGKCL